MPAALAARTPLRESSTTSADAGDTARRLATSRYTSGAGLPCATSSDETTTSNVSVSPVEASAAAMTSA